MPEPAFLFDLDGVLVDTHRIVIDGWLAYAASRGRALTEAEIVDRFFGRRSIDILVDQFGIDTHTAETMMRTGFDDKTADVERAGGLQPVGGAVQFAWAALAQGIPCAVASSASAANIHLALDSIGLAGAFSVIIDHDRVERGKPAPDAYLAAAAGLGVAPAGCLVFEDTPVGIAAGKAAGARCIGVASLGRPDRLVDADLVIDDFRGLTPIALLSRLDAAARLEAVPAARCRDTSMAGDAGEHPR
jgi:HAD superfamily hydrolase (TIGR01509 family)